MHLMFRLSARTIVLLFVSLPCLFGCDRSPPTKLEMLTTPAPIDELEDEKDPQDAFNVSRTDDGIKIKHGRADNPDLELALSFTAVEKLTGTTTKEEYASKFGEFYNDPDEEDGWIDFILHKRTKTLIKMGYGKFAESAGILEDESQV